VPLKTDRVKVMLDSIIFLIFAGMILLLILQLFYGLIFKEGKNTRMIKAVVGSAYFARTNEFKIYNRFAKPGGIVFVGDSLTQRYPLSEFYPGLPVYNRGIDGDTTQGLMKRMALSIFDLQPKVVVLQIGTNDLQVAELPKEITVGNLRQIVAMIQKEQPAIKIILVSLYPVNETTEKLVEKIIVGPRKNVDLEWINKAIKSIEDVHFVNVYPLLLNEEKQLDMRYSKEGLHLSLAGYATITPPIIAAIESLF
jgi:lysophospholipase L1-like esterase